MLNWKISEARRGSAAATSSQPLRLPRLGSLVVFAALLCVGSKLPAKASEVPLGGSSKTFVERFNAMAAGQKSSVRMQGKACPARHVCNFDIGNGVDGHVTAVSASKPIVETMLISHDCTALHASVIREVAAVLVKLFANGATAGDLPLGALTRAVEANNDQRTVVVIEGVEFTNSAVSCTLLVARPQKRRP